ncbi:MAG: DUF1353 domain-containing protein [bacterium]|nr:DUF1353 domain-containing protein [bacterium]
MYKWYSNKKVTIYFDKIPQVAIRYSLPSDSLELKKSIKKYPFINKRNLKVLLEDNKKKKVYFFEIPKGYCYDGASIPKVFWRVIGSNTDNSFLIPALIHDVICQNHSYIENDRKFSSEVFSALLEASGVFPFKRYLMKNAVDVHQRFCHWDRGK